MFNCGAHEDSKIKKLGPEDNPDSGYLELGQCDIKVRDKIQNLELTSQQQIKPFISGVEIKQDPEKPFISGSDIKEDPEKPFVSGSQIKQDPEKSFISGSEIREDSEKPKPGLIVPTTTSEPVEKVTFNHRQEYTLMEGAWRLKNLISTIFILK